MEPRLARFWVVLAVTTVPFYMWGALTGGDLVVVGAQLPLSALMFVCPAVATLAAGGGPRAAWRRMLTRPRAFWVGFALVVPAVLTLVSSLMIAGGGLPGIPSSLPLVAGAYVVAAVCEELGWTGVLMPALLRRHGVLHTGTVIGVVWALWHLIPYLQAGYAPGMLLGQLVFTVVFRILLVQVTVAGNGAPIVAVLGHASYNVAWTLLDARDAYSPGRPRWRWPSPWPSWRGGAAATAPGEARCRTARGDPTPLFRPSTTSGLKRHCDEKGDSQEARRRRRNCPARYCRARRCPPPSASATSRSSRSRASRSSSGIQPSRLRHRSSQSTGPVWPRSALQREQAAASLATMLGPPLRRGTRCSVVGGISRPKRRPHHRHRPCCRSTATARRAARSTCRW